MISWKRQREKTGVVYVLHTGLTSFIITLHYLLYNKFKACAMRINQFVRCDVHTCLLCMLKKGMKSFYMLISAQQNISRGVSTQFRSYFIVMGKNIQFISFIGCIIHIHSKLSSIFNGNRQIKAAVMSLNHCSVE